MSRRIDVELTSRRDDGSWTWRAAGAREPKGVVEAELLPGEPKVGDVLKVEIETFLDGIGILSVAQPRNSRAEPQRLELLGPSRPERLVTTTLAPRGRGERDRPRRSRDERGDGPRRDGGRDGDRRERRPRDGNEGDRRGRSGGGGDGGDDRRQHTEAKPRLKRLRPGRTHRRELIAELPEEQRPIAEELAKGGIPGVRAALEAQSAQAKAEGKPEINPAPLLAMAEELWPRMRTAEWRDRAEAAISEVDELDLRDLRSVVVAADSAARDDESRALAAQLREALGRRVDEEHSRWLTELAELVAENRIVAALRRSSRPPKAGAPLPSDLAQLLVDRTSESLHAEAGTERWSVLLDALSFSPVRSSVTPASVPEHPSDELLNAVRRAAPRLPQIAALFGIEAAPAPPPNRGGRRSGGGGRGGAPARRGDRPIPAPPPLPQADGGAPGTDAGPEAGIADATGGNEADLEATTPEATTPEATTPEADAPPTDSDSAGESESESESESGDDQPDATASVDTVAPADVADDSSEPVEAVESGPAAAEVSSAPDAESHDPAAGQAGDEVAERASESAQS